MIERFDYEFLKNVLIDLMDFFSFKFGIPLVRSDSEPSPRATTDPQMALSLVGFSDSYMVVITECLAIDYKFIADYHCERQNDVDR